MEVFEILVLAEVREHAACAMFLSHLLCDFSNDRKEYGQDALRGGTKSLSDGTCILVFTTMCTGQKGLVWWKAARHQSR